jgi:EAL domain-containing protein (putative c-di-GMP-specific phosphodiesterase class I)
VTHAIGQAEHRVIPPFENVGRSPALVARGRPLPGHGSRPRDRRGQQLSISLRLRNAIETNQLSVHYQPQYELRGGRHCGVEALARWLSPKGGSIPPAAFILAAEKKNLIIALGAWVLDEACKTVGGWHRCGGAAPILCVNVSPRQITPDFYRILAGTLERTGFPARQLELEITEGILIDKPELALHCLAQWKRLGVRIALDDFGTGYSSLSYLSRMPVDRVKVDRSLISRMIGDPKTAAIVRAVIGLGSDLGFDVLAEGVESEEQLAMLSGMGCQQVQGYLLAMPACAEEARRLLAVDWGSRPIERARLDAHSDNRSPYAS